MASATRVGEPDTPAHLFVELWHETSGLTASQRSNTMRPPAHFHKTALGIAGLDDPAHAVEALRALLQKQPAEAIGRQLAVMIAIDELFAALHPRTPRAAGPGTVHLPAWMNNLQDRRTVSGFYLELGGMLLLPRGPLLRTPRDPHASSADTLEDRFTYLTAMSQTVTEKGASIAVKFRCVGMNLFDGVEPVAKPGQERISFVPIAETANDLEIRPVTLNETIYAQYGPKSTLAGGQRIIDVLEKRGKHDLAVAPELVMSPDQAFLVQNRLRKAASPPNLLLLGTQNSTDNENGQPFNEALLMNSVGTLLSRQRKIWPASIDAQQACELGLCDSAHEARVIENNASAREIDVVDIDGFGRVVVLICQDLMLEAASNLVARLQPDWVLVPILADDLERGRWAHRRALTISETAQSRFVAVTSTALSCANGQDPTAAFGFALGPAVPADADENQRAVVFVKTDRTASPHSGFTIWHGPEWIQSTVQAG